VVATTGVGVTTTTVATTTVATIASVATTTSIIPCTTAIPEDALSVDTIKVEMEGRLGALAKEKKASHVRNPYRKANNLERPDKVLFSTCTG
jgi:hypothetical protein